MRTRQLIWAILFLLGTIPGVHAQSSTHNYVKQETMLNTSKSQKITSVQYYDGYSRPVLQTRNGMAGGGKYTFALTTYDNVGRVSESWLPAVGTTSSNFLTASEVKSLSSSTYGDSYAYTRNHYDALSRTTSVAYDVSLVDNLTLSYNGNQLTKVEDATGNTAGFTNSASQANEYTYDANGNLTKDLNKGITNISYNVLSFDKIGFASEILK